MRALALALTLLFTGVTLAPLQAQNAPPSPAQAKPAQKPVDLNNPDNQPALKLYERPSRLDAMKSAFERDVVRKATRDTRPVADLRKEADEAMKRQDFGTAANAWLAIALQSGQDSAPWVRVSMAYQPLAKGNHFDRQYAFGAATLGLNRARTRLEEAFALNQLARLFEQSGDYRDAMTAMKAALAAKDNPQTREAYDRLRAEYGFRFKEHRVDVKSATPRLCMVMSEALDAGKVDYTPYVKVENLASPALTVEGNQICVDGLKHGETYLVHLREGMPAQNGEMLVRPVDIRALMPDRTAEVRPMARAYVLPKSGQQGLPISTVNLDRVQVEIHRISDRNLVNQFAEGDLSPPSLYSINQMKDTAAIPVWSGEMEVKNVPNQEVVTALPIEETLKELKTGLYLIYAAPVNAQTSSDDDYDNGGYGASQYFLVSDIGLATFGGNDGLHVFAHSLATAKALKGARVKLINKANEVVATRTTDGEGHAVFEPGLTADNGALSPALVTAEADNDFGFLSLTRPAFDLSDRGVSGRTAPGPLDAFITPERGVYRSGETVNLTVLVRDARGMAVGNLPVTIIIQRPDGVEYRRIVAQDGGAGGRTVALPIISSAPTGLWTASVKTDPKKDAIGSVKFMVEDFVPDRITFDLALNRQIVTGSDALGATIDARFLFGAAGANLAVEGEVMLKPTDALPAFPDYVFGPLAKGESGSRAEIEAGFTTDDNGHLTLTLPMPDGDRSGKPMAGEVAIRASESGGRAVEKTAAFTLLPEGALIGVKPSFKDERSGENEDVSFHVIKVEGGGLTRAQGKVSWQLKKIETRYQWSRYGGAWNSETIEVAQRVAEGVVDVSAKEGGVLKARVDWGRYRLELKDGEQSRTDFTFEAGWGGGATADTPDVLEMSLAKQTFRTGDTLSVNVKPRHAGIATLMIVGDGLYAQTAKEIGPDGGTLQLPVAANWGGGAYAMVIHRRPLDTRAGRMPSRSIGLGWFDIDRSERQLAVTIKAPDKMVPRSRLSVPVSIEGAAGQTAYLTLAAVDVGILNVTGFEPPKPEDHYLGQRMLSGELHDLYNQLIDGMQGTRGKLRSGGDEAAMKRPGSPPAQDPVSLFSGLVTVGADGRVEISFDVPDFNGTLRLMAMAWTKQKTGSAAADTVVRDPVVALATLPRAMRAKDEAQVHLDLRNVEGPAGRYLVDITAEGAARMQPVSRDVMLAAGEAKSLSLPIIAGAPGLTALAVTLKGPNGLTLVNRYTMLVRPAYAPISRRTVMSLAPGGTLTLGRDVFADMVVGETELAVAVDPSTSFDVAGLLHSLERYPYGCTEQTVSRAMPLLYLSDLGGLSVYPTEAEPLRVRLQEAVDKILSRQNASGAFGLWSASSDTNYPWLNAFAADLLIRAEAKGLTVPQTALKKVIERLRSQVSGNESLGGNGGQDIAYTHYVLARAGYGNIGDLRWLADSKMQDIKTPLAKAQIAAALGLMGDRTRAETLMRAALAQVGGGTTEMSGRIDYGSRLRDAAAIMALVDEGKMPTAMITQARQLTESLRASQRSTSTQEKLWLTLAARALQAEAKAMKLEVNGQPFSGAYARIMKAEEAVGGLTVRNLGSNAVGASVTATGTPMLPEPAISKDFTLERRYFTFDGKPVDVRKVARNTRLVVVLTIHDLSGLNADVIVNDPLPAGFEIDNPALVSSAESSRFEFVPTGGAQPVHTEFRDDRFSAAYRLDGRNSPDTMVVSYVVRAVNVGKFVHSGATVEDMYRPDRLARTSAGMVEVSEK